MINKCHLVDPDIEPLNVHLSILSPGGKFGWRDQHFFCRGSKNLARGQGIKTLTSQCLPSLQLWPLLTSNFLPSLQLWPLFTFHFQTCSRWLSASEAAPGSQTANTDDQVLMIRPYIRYKMIEMLRWWIIIDGANKKKDVLGHICFCFFHEMHVSFASCDICFQL